MTESHLLNKEIGNDKTKCREQSRTSLRKVRIDNLLWVSANKLHLMWCINKCGLFSSWFNSDQKLSGSCEAWGMCLCKCARVVWVLVPHCYLCPVTADEVWEDVTQAWLIYQWAKRQLRSCAMLQLCGLRAQTCLRSHTPTKTRKTPQTKTTKQQDKGILQKLGKHDFSSGVRLKYEDRERDGNKITN